MTNPYALLIIRYLPHSVTIDGRRQVIDKIITVVEGDKEKVERAKRACELLERMDLGYTFTCLDIIKNER